MEAKGPVTRRKERWMAVALVVLSVAVVALSGALAVVARQENATVIPVEGVETQSGAEPTAVSEAAADPVEELVGEQAGSDEMAAKTTAPDAATVEIAGDPPEEPVEENAGTDELDATTATPDAATVEVAGDPPEEPVGGLSEDDYAELGELVSKFQDAERQLSENERAALVELASRLRAGAIIFPEDEDGELMYQFYTGEEYPLGVDHEGRARAYCRSEYNGYFSFGSLGPGGSWDRRFESKRKYYEELHREVYSNMYPDFEDDLAEADFTYLRNEELTIAQAFYHMYGQWLHNHVPFVMNMNYGDIYDGDDYIGAGIEMMACPKVLQTDLPSRLSQFAEVIPIQILESGGSRVDRIEDWWESRNGGD